MYHFCSNFPFQKHPGHFFNDLTIRGTTRRRHKWLAQDNLTDGR